MERWTVDHTLDTELGEVREVSLRLVAGDVAVTAGEGPAHIEVHHREGQPVDIRLRDGVLRIEQGRQDESMLQRMVSFVKGGGRAEASVTLVVPASTKLDLASVAAPIVVSGMTERARIKTVSGDITLDELGESVDVKTVSGDVEGRRVAADIRMATVSGDITLVDGRSRSVVTKTVSGDVTLDLDLEPTGHYELSTVSGTLAIRTSGEPSVVVEATSVSGEVISDWGVSFPEGRPGRRHLRERIGDGGARLRVKSVSGDLRLVRGRGDAA